MEIIGSEARKPEDSNYMTTLKEWGPEYELSFQLKFNTPQDMRIADNIFRLTIFNNDNSGKTGNAIPSMWTMYNTQRLKIVMATSIDHGIPIYDDLIGFINTDKYYNFVLKQVKTKVNMFNLSKYIIANIYICRNLIFMIHITFLYILIM